MSEQCGTPAYIAPEIIKDKGYKGFKSDMWSAGVCLYVMLIGTVPFRAATMEDLHIAIRKGTYDLQDEKLSEDAKNILSCLICSNPKKRFSAQECLSHPWLKDVDIQTPDLGDIIFTDKEKDTIKKDYLHRLERLKQKRLNKKGPDGDLLFTEHALDTKEDEAKPNNSNSIQQFFSQK